MPNIANSQVIGIGHSSSALHTFCAERHKGLAFHHWLKLTGRTYTLNNVAHGLGITYQYTDTKKSYSQLNNE